MRHSNQGLSSFGEGLPKGSDVLSLLQKSKTVRKTITFIRRRGGQATGNTRTAHKGREAYADIIATIAGQPVEVLLGVRRLSPARLNYSRSITAAGGIFLVITTVREFEDFYNETFKSTAQ